MRLVPRRLASALRAAALTALVGGAGLAAAISYTVQVIAVSDQDGAFTIYRELAGAGFPAYVVRTTGAQGDVYRVRVGAFANRSAALRYAESMPDVAGSRPVPALAEAIPQGIMPLAPRLLLQHAWTGEEVRVLPWPSGIALRIQQLEPLRQADYVVFQDGTERRFGAWDAVPLRELPALSDVATIGIPMVDLTVPPADDGARAGERDDDPLAAPEGEAPVGEEPQGADDAEGEGDVAATEDAPPDAARADGAGDAPIDWANYLARPDDGEPEEGLALVRDRPLWPPSWEDEDESVRSAFRASSVTLVAGMLGADESAVEALAYRPGGEPPPSLVVLTVTDRSARETGTVLALGDPRRGERASGAELVLPVEDAEPLPSWPSTRVEPDETSTAESVGGDDWQATADGAFVRLTLPDGATWRAGVGAPIWSDGTVVLAWDGRNLLLYDFVPR